MQRAAGRCLLGVACFVLAGCGDSAATPVDAGAGADVDSQDAAFPQDDAGALDAALPDSGLDAAGPSNPDASPDAGAADPCSGFVVPQRPQLTACGDVDPDAPSTLASCQHGSGHQGLWTVDPDGMPAYDFAIEQRCDPAGRAWSPRPYPLRDPIHLIGNGRGLVAMAHASGGIEIYTQDRGHAWINRVDTWRDRMRPDYPPQLGGGFSYLAIDGEVRSTRFEDLPIAEASMRQTRRFGVGYFETVSTWDDVIVRRRVLAPDDDARALVVEVTVESRASSPLEVGLVELWDPNLHEVSVELATSDIVPLGITAGIDRRRRDHAASFTHDVSWDPARAVIEVTTSAASLPGGIDRGTPGEENWFPYPMWLAALDADPGIDAVWIDDRDLWGPTIDRSPPGAVAGAGSSNALSRTIEGAGQHVALAMRVPLTIAPGASVTRRFAFGYSPEGATTDAAVTGLRARASTIAAETTSSWRDRMIWAAFPGLERSSSVQRELAWSSYYTLANVTYDEYRGVRLAGQGGAYKYIHGLDGAVGDLALFADALLFLDPEVARETLVYTLGTQHGSTAAIAPPGVPAAWRYPYATTGHGYFSDVGIYGQRSDAYWLVPASVGRYVLTTRDETLLDLEVPYWPIHAGERGTVIDHLRRSIEYAETSLGYGSQGLPAMGTGDYADGVLQLHEGPTSRTGTSSSFNQLFAIGGLPLAADALESRDATFAASLRAIATAQRDRLESATYLSAEGYYSRGFADDGAPLAGEFLFVEPQVLPILYGVVDATRRDALLDLVNDRFETPLGAMTTVALGSNGGGSAEPQVNGVWPVASAWVTEAWSLRDPARGWSSLIRNTLFTHAELYPEIWYGVWTGPDSYFGPDAERPGEADAHAATALTDYPALNAHVHVGPIRSLLALIGARGTANGLAITPRLPIERWSVRLPRLRLSSFPDRLEGSFAASATGPIELRVGLPSGVSSNIVVRVEGAATPARVEDGHAVFTLPARAGEHVSFAIGSAP